MTRSPPFRLPSLLLAAVCLAVSGPAAAAYLCQDKDTGRKTMSDQPCDEQSTQRNTGEGRRHDTPPWQTQARQDRCKVLIQKANSPLKARAYADLCTKPLDDVRFNECVAQINYSNSPTKLSASVATCTSDPSAVERLTPAPVIIQRGYQ